VEHKVDRLFKNLLILYKQILE